jgi:hypothetical protein
LRKGLSPAANSGGLSTRVSKRGVLRSKTPLSTPLAVLRPPAIHEG